MDALDSNSEVTARDAEIQGDIGYQMTGKIKISRIEILHLLKLFSEPYPEQSESLEDSEDDGAVMNNVMAQPFVLKYVQP